MHLEPVCDMITRKKQKKKIKFQRRWAVKTKLKVLNFEPKYDYLLRKICAHFSELDLCSLPI